MFIVCLVVLSPLLERGKWHFLSSFSPGFGLVKQSGRFNFELILGFGNCVGLVHPRINGFLLCFLKWWFLFYSFPHLWCVLLSCSQKFASCRDKCHGKTGILAISLNWSCPDEGFLCSLSTDFNNNKNLKFGVGFWMLTKGHVYMQSKNDHPLVSFNSLVLEVPRCFEFVTHLVIDHDCLQLVAFLFQHKGLFALRGLTCMKLKVWGAQCRSGERRPWIYRSKECLFGISMQPQKSVHSWLIVLLEYLEKGLEENPLWWSWFRWSETIQE